MSGDEASFGIAGAMKDAPPPPDGLDRLQGRTATAPVATEMAQTPHVLYATLISLRAWSGASRRWGSTAIRPAELALMTTPNSLMKKLRGYFTGHERDHRHHERDRGCRERPHRRQRPRDEEAGPGQQVGPVADRAEGGVHERAQRAALLQVREEQRDAGDWA